MSPKQKANDLVDQNRIILMDADTDCGYEILCTSIAIKCALIAVDEILLFMVSILKWDNTHNGNVQYYLEVKTELEKL